MGVLICLAGSCQVWGQAAQPVAVIDHEYEIKAKYLYYLAAFIAPTSQASTAGDSGKEIRIAVIGEAPQDFRATASLPAHSTIKDQNSPRTVKWQYFKSLAEFQAEYPREAGRFPRFVFLVGSSSGTKLDEDVTGLAEHVGDAAVVIVTEDNQKFRQLAAVNFYEDKAANRVRMQVRKSSLSSRNLTALPAFLASPAVLPY